MLLPSEPLTQASHSSPPTVPVPRHHAQPVFAPCLHLLPGLLGMSGMSSMLGDVAGFGICFAGEWRESGELCVLSFIVLLSRNRPAPKGGAGTGYPEGWARHSLLTTAMVVEDALEREVLELLLAMELLVVSELQPQVIAKLVVLVLCLLELRLVHPIVL